MRPLNLTATPATGYDTNDAEEEVTTTRRVRVGRNDTEELKRLQRQMGISTIADQNERSDMFKALQARGIDSFDELIAALDSAKGPHRPRPKRALSPLFSDLEVRSALDSNTGTIDIPTVADGNGVQTVTIPAKPMRWYFTDFSVDGALAGGSSGFLFRVKVEVLIGSSPVAEFRVSEFGKPTVNGMVNDALTTLFAHSIGPSSIVRIRVTNQNVTDAGDFDGVFSYAFDKAEDA